MLKGFRTGLGLYIGIAVFMMCFSSLLQAQVKGVFYGVDFDDSPAVVKAKLSPHCQSVKIITNQTPSFPLAQNSESHLICEKIELEDNLIKEIIFAFGDEKLSLIEARGGAVKFLTGKATGSAADFMHYKGYFEDLMVIDTKEDAVWLLSKESAHPNLFSWSNPYLPSNGSNRRDYQQSAQSPDILKFGAKLKDLSPDFEKKCKIVFTRNIKKVWLPNKSKTQTQIDCFGFEYAGFPRKIEAVFGDDVLELAWILTGKGEEDRVRQALIKAYGQAVFVNENWEAFNDWQVVLRKDKPEVLVLSKKLVPIYKERYGSKQ
jgi:hypothetical protein